jgi:hypothetical protein
MRCRYCTFVVKLLRSSELDVLTVSNETLGVHRLTIFRHLANTAKLKAAHIEFIWYLGRLHLSKNLVEWVSSCPMP